MEEKKFYIFFNDEAQGPFSERGLEMLFTQKRITSVTLVCSEDDQNWISYSDFLKNRPVVAEQSRSPVISEVHQNNPEQSPVAAQRPSIKATDIKETKIPFTSLVVEAFSICGRLIIILAIVFAAIFFFAGIMSKDTFSFSMSLLGAIGIFLGSLIYGGIFIAIANIVQCQLVSVDLLKKLVEQTRK